MEAEDSNDSFLFEYCSTPASREEQQMKRFLGELKLEYLSDLFKDCGVTYGRLRYLNKEDFEEILPGRENIGVRAEIREKLLKWKAKRPHSEETTIIQPQKRKRIINWIEMQEKSIPSPSPSILPPPTVPLIMTTIARSSSLLNVTSSNSPTNIQYQNIREILQNSIQGQSIIKFYDDNKFLDEFNRKELLNCIAENFFDITTNEFKIPRPCEMEKMAEEIVEMFPSEDKDAYYISRRAAKRPNPMGRLFNRFNNLNRNRRQAKNRMEKLNGEANPTINETLDKKTELKMADLKAKMKEMVNTDKDATTYWVQSYELRKLEYANLSSISDIFHEWVFLKQNGGEKFVDIDFDMMFPSAKGNLMNKWELYRQKLLYYYNANLKENQFKALFDEMQSKPTDKDSEDCILVVLLNAVLKPTHRHVETGPDAKRIVRKASINDAINSFILHLPVLKDLEYALEGRSTIQPFIIVVGLKLSELREFYISIGDTVLKTISFIAALDLCFKIFHVFDLNYSKESLLVWLFLQKCIYGINTVHDIKNSAIAELVASLQSI